MHTAPTVEIVRPETVRRVGVVAEPVSKRGGRSINADAVAAATDSMTGRTAFVVADGVGDHLLAARAARTVATVAAQVGARTGAHAGILAAQEHLRREFPEEHADCVLVVVVLPANGQLDGRTDIAWVGDCRAYRYNGTVLHQITTDHTLGEFLRAHGQHAAPRMNHLVTTSARTVKPDEIGKAATGSSTGRWLLSTDGVHKRVDIVTIKSILAADTPVALAADTFTQTALDLGGTDNTTAFVLDYRVLG
ncbi:PP2C family protein-serine/threonine phosphatase [Nocardia sp. NPDC052566]|uniref:PP2C family protein-serine/threonine phosphatase n=1 Tax=Nocardia sp. NPDC052566 TaxID=3364330 RepID=UPI0037C5C369